VGAFKKRQQEQATLLCETATQGEAE
jgi:hypothetical protein